MQQQRRMPIAVAVYSSPCRPLVTADRSAVVCAPINAAAVPFLQVASAEKLCECVKGEQRFANVLEPHCPLRNFSHATRTVSINYESLVRVAARTVQGAHVSIDSNMLCCRSLNAAHAGIRRRHPPPPRYLHYQGTIWCNGHLQREHWRILQRHMAT